MTFKDIVYLFKRDKKQKERFAGILGKSGEKASTTIRPIPILDDEFTEASTGIFAQLKKYPFLDVLELLETTKTSLSIHSIFVIEILNDTVNAAIVSRKGVFLDIGFLKSYSYDDLMDIYSKIVSDVASSPEEIKNSIENVISIVAYDVVYALPKKIVIIESSNSELREVSIRTGRFTDDSDAEDLMMRDIVLSTGFNRDEIIYSIIKKPFKKGDKEIRFLVSLAQKEYYDSIDSYVNEAGFSLKKIHSLESSLYASFKLRGRSAIMRIHVQDSIAYTLHKIVDENFEYNIYDIKEEYEALELTALRMEEVILSGSGDYYDMLKSSFLEAGIGVRWWNYEYDLSRCIIRIEEGYELNNSHANIISTAYYELFNTRMAIVRLGVGKKLSFYEIIALNISIAPILMVVFTLFGAFGWYYYEDTKLKELSAANKEYSKYFKDKKSLKSQASRHKTKISSAQKKIAKIEKIIKDKIEIKDAAILYEIAVKLPDDMILTEIQKNPETSVITIKGKSFLERSLLNYIKDLSFEGKKVYLTEMIDSKKTRLESEEEANMRLISELARELDKHEAQGDDEEDTQRHDDSNIKMLELLLGGGGTEVEYADTLNNSFTLEIRGE